VAQSVDTPEQEEVDELDESFYENRPYKEEEEVQDDEENEDVDDDTDEDEDRDDEMAHKNSTMMNPMMTPIVQCIACCVPLCQADAAGCKDKCVACCGPHFKAMKTMMAAKMKGKKKAGRGKGKKQYMKGKKQQGKRRRGKKGKRRGRSVCTYKGRKYKPGQFGIVKFKNGACAKIACLQGGRWSKNKGACTEAQKKGK